MQPPTVPTGTTSKAGYAATVVGLIATALAVVFPDVPQQGTAAVAGAAFTILSFVVTQVGRYVQANQLARQVPYAFVQAETRELQATAYTDVDGSIEKAYSGHSTEKAYDDEESRPLDDVGDDDPERADVVDPGPDEAEGDEALEPHYPGRASPDEDRDAQLAARLKWEQEGDACDLDEKIVKSEVEHR